MSEDKKLITFSQAKELTGIPSRTLRHAAQKKKLRYEQYGPIKMTTLEWIEEWKNNPEAHRRPPKRKRV
jgi:hypothetical protein